MILNNPLLHKPSRPLPKNVVVVGAGTIGPDIGYYLKSAILELKLTLLDVAQAPLDRAHAALFRLRAQGGRARQDEPETGRQGTAHNIHAILDYEVAREADWVIEAATEDLALKRRIFARLEALMRPDALITSNTSSLPAARIFSELRHKNRATVTHFFAPAWRNPVVEVIRTPDARSPGDRGSALDFLHDRQGADRHRGRALLHAGSGVRQLVQRGRASARSRRAPPRSTPSPPNSSMPGRFSCSTSRTAIRSSSRPTRCRRRRRASTTGPRAIFRSVGAGARCRRENPCRSKPKIAAAIRDRLLGILISQTGDILDRGIGAAGGPGTRLPARHLASSPARSI